jgi:hypothetical protein
MYIDYFRNIYAKNVEVADKESNPSYIYFSVNRIMGNIPFQVVDKCIIRIRPQLTFYTGPIVLHPTWRTPWHCDEMDITPFLSFRGEPFLVLIRIPVPRSILRFAGQLLKAARIGFPPLKAVNLQPDNR